MTSIFHTTKSLPLSQPTTTTTTTRRRISAVQTPSLSTTTAWALQTSKSASTSLKTWWEWILSRKPGFALDLEMSQEERSVLGSNNKGSWRHVIYKFSSQIWKLVGSDQPGLPQTIRGNGSFKSTF